MDGNSKKGDGDATGYDEEFNHIAVFRRQFDRLETMKKKLINLAKSGQRRTQRIFYERQFESVPQLVRDFQEDHELLVGNLSSEEKKGYAYFTGDAAEQFEDAQMDFIIALQKEQEAYFPPVNNAPPVSNAANNHAHLVPKLSLPTISIPTFNGAHTEWKTFHDLFKSIIHTNEHLPGSHKFQYLIGALTGEARDLLSAYTICDDDYQKAWDALKEHYDDQPATFVHLMNQFNALESATKENPDHLRQLVKETAACFKALEGIGIEQTNIDSIVTYYLIRKLPTVTVAYWEEVRDRKQLPKFEAVKRCIETRIRVTTTVASIKHGMPSCETKSEGTKIHSQSSASANLSNLAKGKRGIAFHASTKPKTISSVAPTPVTSVSGASTTSNGAKPAGRKFTCPVCSTEGHPLRACDQFLGMPACERKNIIGRLQYCANCLAFDHQEGKCRSRFTCFTCGERHHSLLHMNASSHTANHATAAPTSVLANACNATTDMLISQRILLVSCG